MTGSQVEPLVRRQRHDVPGVAVVRAAGEIDMFGAPALERAVSAELAASPRALILDVSEVSFLAAAGVGVISRAARIAGERGVAMLLIARGGAVLRTLELTGVDRLVPIGASRDDTVAMLDEPDDAAASSTVR